MACTVVVVINVHRTHCDALILRDLTSPIIHVPLDSFEYDTAKELHRDLVEYLVQKNIRIREDLNDCAEIDSCQSRPRPMTKVTPGRHNIESILEILWVHVVNPVICALGYEVVSNTETIPHITWCGTGPLAFLPIHAAGYYSEPDLPRLFQYVVSSYTPTLTALMKSLQSPSQPAPHILAVSQPNTPGHSRLPGTVTEVKAINGCIGTLPFKWLNEEGATIAAVLEAMEECSWVHFACHGIQHTEDPMRSAFALHDGYLDLQTIMTRTFKSAEIAFLSACQTAKGDEKRPEEAIHLAAGMLMAGYRTVFATMWSIGDKEAPVVAEEVYKQLMKDYGREKGREVYALHHAVEVLRNMVGEGAFERWLPFIHFGA